MGFEGPKQSKPQADFFEDLDSLKRYTDPKSDEFKERMTDLVIAARDKQRASGITPSSAYILTEQILAQLGHSHLSGEIAKSVIAKLRERDDEKARAEMRELSSAKKSADLDKFISDMPEEGISDKEQDKRWWQR